MSFAGHGGLYYKKITMATFQDGADLEQAQVLIFVQMCQALSRYLLYQGNNIIYYGDIHEFNNSKKATYLLWNLFKQGDNA